MFLRVWPEEGTWMVTADLTSEARRGRYQFATFHTGCRPGKLTVEETLAVPSKCFQIHSVVGALLSAGVNLWNRCGRSCLSHSQKDAFTYIFYYIMGSIHWIPHMPGSCYTLDSTMSKKRQFSVLIHGFHFGESLSTRQMPRCLNCPSCAPFLAPVTPSESIYGLLPCCVSCSRTWWTR